MVEHINLEYVIYDVKFYFPTEREEDAYRINNFSVLLRGQWAIFIS